MKLFICHVSEDKADFVEPLARALRSGFDVWYDNFQLTLGDSLLQKITEGLLSSDFGVVVLSKAFFAKKKWAENELAALFALESTTRKIILPVWKDVTEAEVKAYSPILANRFAVSASQGLQKVVDEIKLAVSVSERKDEIARDETSSKVKALVETLSERKEAERLAYSEEGAQLVSKNFDLLCTEIQRIIERGVGTANVIKFGFARPMQHVLYVNTAYGMYLGLGLRSFFINSVTHAVLGAKIFKRQFGAFGDPESSGQIFNEIEFKPSFRRGEVIWLLNGEKKRVFATGELAAHLVETFVECITEQADVA
jgi:hypothetical protein